MTKPLPTFSMEACSLDTSRSARRSVFAGWRPSVVLAPSGNSLSLPSRSRPVRYGPRGLVRTDGTWLDESDSPHAAHLGGLGWARGVRQRGQALSIGPSADVTRLAPVRIKQRPEDFSVKESYRFDPVPGRAVPGLPDGQAEAVHLRGGGAHPDPLRPPPGRHQLLRPEGQAGPHRAADRRGRRRGRLPGARPPPEATGSHRSGSVGGEHHLQPFQRHGPRPHRRGPPGAPPRCRRGEPTGGGELLRQPALRLAEARPGLHRQGPHPGRLRGRPEELPGEAVDRSTVPTTPR